MNESSVRNILKKKDEIKKQGTHTAEYGAQMLTKIRSRAMLEMERLVFIWITDCNHRRVAISLDETQFKAKSLYDFVKSRFTDLTESEKKETFDASNGWWHRFSKRMNLGSITMLGEAGSADTKAAAEFPAKLKKIMEGKNLSKIEHLFISFFLAAMFMTLEY